MHLTEDAREARRLLESVMGLVIGELPRILAGRQDVTWKPDARPVTSADVFLEGLIRDFLASRLPDLDFIG